VKRLLREITRVAAIAPGWDIVFIARPLSATTDFAILKNNVLNLLSRARILEIKPPAN
jgi:ribonuclease P protein component